MLPSVFSERLFDNVFGDPFSMMANFHGHGHGSVFGKHGKNLMKTDVRELENSYELDVDLPGFKKEQVNVELDDGYMTICAAKGMEHDEEKRGQYIRRERSSGECCRTFYIGKGDYAKENMIQVANMGEIYEQDCYNMLEVFGLVLNKLKG